MNTRVFTSWLLMICPIAMMVIFAGLEPLIIGEVDENLPPKEEALATLELFQSKEIAAYIINISGLTLMMGATLGLALLGKSLKGGGAAIGTLSSMIFTAVLAIPIISMGLYITGNDFFSDGYKDAAVSLEMIGDAAFRATPLFWGIGYALLGLGMILEKGPLPTILAWLLFLGGLAMFSTGAFIGAAGFLIFLIMIIVVVISGVFLLRQSD